ncbi:MAG: AAA family ATPase [Oscillospiraceae bacterium]|nr:AAA family ATPase [Oscillospiraceae bacterium]
MSVLLIAGMPGAGKTVQAHYFSQRYRMPFFYKDMFKEILFDTVGFRNLEEKNALDLASMRQMLKAAAAVTETGHDVIIESNFMDSDRPELDHFVQETGQQIVTIRFDCDLDVIYDRCVARDMSSTRHPGHYLMDYYPPKDGVLPLYVPQCTREEYKEGSYDTGVISFEYGPTVSVDTTDFSKMDLEPATEFLDKYFLK